MIKQTDIGQLYIGEESVIIDTPIRYRVLVIEYVGTLKIISTLPNDYILKQGHNKIVIMRMNKGQEPAKDLFKYRGKALITICTLYTSNRNKYTVDIDRRKFDFWDALNVNKDGDSFIWEKITRNYEDLDYNGYNNKRNYIHRKTTYDNETRTTTTTKEIRKR